MSEVDTMEVKRLISSYDEINDTFVGKIDGKNRYCADYSISDGIFLSIDKNHIPYSIFIDGASNVFNISKSMLENSDIKISIGCDSLFVCFNMFIEDLKICSIKSENRYGIPKLNYLMDSNY